MCPLACSRRASTSTIEPRSTIALLSSGRSNGCWPGRVSAHPRPAVDVDRDACHEVAVRRGEEHRDGGDILGNLEPPEWRCRYVVASHLVRGHPPKAPLPRCLALLH